MTTNATRVILLLDLDCFYAQCERVRLGLDAETCCLALMQWNSTLAVTYPARTLYDIKRGDSWEVVAQKSRGECLCIHLPLLKSGQSSTLHVEDNNDIESAYEQTFNIGIEERKQSIVNENGRQRFPAEGKSCLERYRLASTRIFGVVLESLEELLGRGNFILERASIDELFFDVTSFCLKDQGSISGDGIAERVEIAAQETVMVGNANVGENDPLDVQLLRRGCWVAKSIRQSVFDKLGFTLSAGISTSKLVAKLGASYGKPNGQAVIYPSAIPYVMNETPIRKVRNLGGKIGKSVVALFPANLEPTMGNLRDYLSLPELAKSLEFESAQRVFENARGIDNETVKETAGVLVKSITAFKSFFKASIGSPEVLKWINLLAVDVVNRVQQDMDRNCRYPKSCSVQYTVSQKVGAEGRSKDRTTKSIRIPFPNKHEKDKQGTLAMRANDSILQREGTAFLHRIGLCAMDFETRAANGGIASFFGMTSDSRKLPRIVVSPAAGIEEKYVGAPVGESVMFSSDSGSITNDSLIVESISPLLDPQCQRECGALTPSGDAGTSMVDLGFASKEHRTVESTSRLKKSISITKAAVEDSDMDFAKKIASYI